MVTDPGGPTSGELWRGVSITRLTDLLGVPLPIVQAPMAGASTISMAVAVSEAGGLGSLAGAMLGAGAVRHLLNTFREATTRPVNVNFFCSPPPRFDAARATAWNQLLCPYLIEHHLNPDQPVIQTPGVPFSADHCAVIEELRPEVVSFHFGLPDSSLLARVKQSGAQVLSSATTVAEAQWLEAHGCDILIAQGWEAGGHRGTFLTAGEQRPMSTMELTAQVTGAVSVPVLAAGGISDGHSIAAALALGAGGVQIGTAYLFTPEASLSPIQRDTLSSVAQRGTKVTDIFTGRPARAVNNRAIRELDPHAATRPDFPLPVGHLASLRAAAEATGSDDFTPVWAGQSAGLGRHLPAGDLTRLLMDEAIHTAQDLKQSSWFEGDPAELCTTPITS